MEDVAVVESCLDGYELEFVAGFTPSIIFDVGFALDFKKEVSEKSLKDVALNPQ